MKQKTPIEIVLDDGDEAVRIHTCSVCGTQGQWGSGWSWYGSWRDIDNDWPVVKCCSLACRRKSAADSATDPGLVTP